MVDKKLRFKQYIYYTKFIIKIKIISYQFCTWSLKFGKKQICYVSMRISIFFNSVLLKRNLKNHHCICLAVNSYLVTLMRKSHKNQNTYFRRKRRLFGLSIKINMDKHDSSKIRNWGIADIAGTISISYAQFFRSLRKFHFRSRFLSVL